MFPSGHTLAPAQEGYAIRPVPNSAFLSDALVGSRDDPLFVRWVAFTCTQNLRACVYTGDPAAARWAVVGNFDCVTDADKMLLATDEVFRYVMYALHKGCGGDHYTGITATKPDAVRSVSVTLPDGNAGNLRSVLYDMQDSGVEIEVCIVPLCTPCLRDKPAEYLLEELEKTQCVHSLTDALYEFAKRRLHLAYPTQDGLSAMPHTFPCPTPRNRETEPHRICLQPRLNLWCPDADYDGHFDWSRGKKAS